MIYADGEQYNDYLENALHRSCKENERLKSILNPNSSKFGEIVLIPKKELDALVVRVDELLEANNKELERRRLAESNKKENQNTFYSIDWLIKKINEIDEREWMYGGSCGDGSFDSKMRDLEHKDRITAVTVLNKYFKKA